MKNMLIQILFWGIVYFALIWFGIVLITNN